MPHCFAFFPPCDPSLLSLELGEGFQPGLVPSSQSVYGKVEETDPLGLAAVLELPDLGFVSIAIPLDRFCATLDNRATWSGSTIVMSMEAYLLHNIYVFDFQNVSHFLSSCWGTKHVTQNSVMIRAKGLIWL